MLKVRQTIIVEGRYDKARLTSLIDADILITDGFGIFRDKQMLDTIRRLAQSKGIIILTDSDAAGFRIRSYIAGAVDPAQVTHVYIPDIIGKERRKIRPGAEGKMGVEGVSSKLLLEAFARAGISAEEQKEQNLLVQEDPVTHLDFLEWGLTGGENSAQLRRKLLERLGLPARMNVKTMLATLNALYDKQAVCELLEKLD